LKIDQMRRVNMAIRDEQRVAIVWETNTCADDENWELQWRTHATYRGAGGGGAGSLRKAHETARRPTGHHSQLVHRSSYARLRSLKTCADDENWELQWRTHATYRGAGGGGATDWRHAESVSVENKYDRLFAQGARDGAETDGPP
jgi:hypothetical protein